MQDLHSGTITRAYCRAIYEESVSRCFILPPEQGEVRRSRIGGGERSEPITRMLIIPYDTKSQSRNADFILIAQRAIPQPSAQRAVKLTNLKNLRGEAPPTLTPQACPIKISFLFLPKSLKAPAMKRRGLSFPYGRWNRGKPLSMMLHRTCVLCCFRIC